MKASSFYAQLAATPTQYLTTINGKRLWMKRDDLNDPVIQGNKLRKLKASLLQAEQRRIPLISFGGAYSNHIAALAAAGKRFNIPTIGIIRGDELSEASRWGHTLQQAHANAMKLVFVDRSEYREKECGHTAQALIAQHANAMVIPEGGSSALALSGVSEVIDELACDLNTPVPDKLFCACGTGGTLAGFIEGVARNNLSMALIGIAVLKGGDFLLRDIAALTTHTSDVNWTVMLDYHAGGYGKVNEALLNDIQDFEHSFNILLDEVYTGKLVRAVIDLAQQSSSESENWMIYHSGGLQGRASSQIIKK